LVFAVVFLVIIVFPVCAPFSAYIPEKMPKIRDEIPHAPAKVPVFEDVLVELVADLVEVIHVELPDKGGEVAVPEIGRQDLLLEPLNVQNGKVSSFLVPAHDARVLIALSY
jgi:hypothetical protein